MVVSVTDVYQLKTNTDNPSIFEYERTGDVVSASTLAFDEETQTYSCTNILKEIAYTVIVSEAEPDELSSSAYLRVEGVQALIVT